MAVLAIVDTVLLVLAIVYIVALLRSHADILRRLAHLEDGAPAPASAPHPQPASAATGAVTGAPAAQAPGAISGTTLDGDAVMLALGAGSPATLLAFLTSGCASCAPLWQGLREAGELSALAERVVVVTHDPSRESPARVRRLAPAGADVVMASAAWKDYGVPASPHFVLTDGRGGISGQGSALSWGQLTTMIGDARADAVPLQVHGPAQRPAGQRTTVERTAVERTTAERTTAERAARSERALAEAGIGPGHPSLYPSRRPPAGAP